MSVRRVVSCLVPAVALLSAGCLTAVTEISDSETSKSAAPDRPAEPAAARQGEPPQAAPDEEGSGSHVGKKTREILNGREAVKDPNWKVVENEISGNDPFSVAGLAYNRLAPQVGTFGLVQWVNTEKTVNGSPPTYVALMKMMEQNPGIELPMLKVYQSYGYDETTGQFVILEHKEKKAERYRELGLPVEP